LQYYQEQPIVLPNGATLQAPGAKKITNSDGTVDRITGIDINANSRYHQPNRIEFVGRIPTEIQVSGPGSTIEGVNCHGHVTLNQNNAPVAFLGGMKFIFAFMDSKYPEPCIQAADGLALLVHRDKCYHIKIQDEAIKSLHKLNPATDFYKIPTSLLDAREIIRLGALFNLEPSVELLNSIEPPKDKHEITNLSTCTKTISLATTPNINDHLIITGQYFTPPFDGINRRSGDPYVKSKWTYKLKEVSLITENNLAHNERRNDSTRLLERDVYPSNGPAILKVGFQERNIEIISLYQTTLSGGNAQEINDPTVLLLTSILNIQIIKIL
jgi:hypothetical protein